MTSTLANGLATKTRLAFCVWSQAPSRGAAISSDGQQRLKMVFVGQTLGIGRQQQPGVRLQFDAPAARAVRPKAVAAEPWKIVSAGAADVFGYRHSQGDRARNSRSSMRDSYVWLRKLESSTQGESAPCYLQPYELYHWVSGTEPQREFLDLLRRGLKRLGIAPEDIRHLSRALYHYFVACIQLPHYLHTLNPRRHPPLKLVGK